MGVPTLSRCPRCTSAALRPSRHDGEQETCIVCGFVQYGTPHPTYRLRSPNAKTRGCNALRLTGQQSRPG